MYPMHLLLLVIALTAGAYAWQFRGRARRASGIRALAERTGLHYSPRDRFGLSARVAKLFPVPGVADVRIFHLLYRSDDRGHHYLFITDHTVGVIGAKRRVRWVARLTEPRATPAERLGRAVLTVADPVGSTVAQYESLLRPDSTAQK